MDGDLILYLGRRALETALLVAAPVLAVTVVIGIATAMIQAVTSVRDMTLGMVMKLAGVAVTVPLRQVGGEIVALNLRRERRGDRVRRGGRRAPAAPRGRSGGRCHG